MMVSKSPSSQMGQSTRMLWLTFALQVLTTKALCQKDHIELTSFLLLLFAQTFLHFSLKSKRMIQFHFSRTFLKNIFIELSNFLPSLAFVTCLLPLFFPLPLAVVKIQLFQSSKVKLNCLPFVPSFVQTLIHLNKLEKIFPMFVSWKSLE